MRNNFTFNASIKKKELDRMLQLIEFMKRENHLSSNEGKILIEFKKLLDSFDMDIKMIEMFDVIDSFFGFYDKTLYPYCEQKNIQCDSIDEFGWSDVQYVMDKMCGIIFYIENKIVKNFN
jgi:hypothetical protein